MKKNTIFCLLGAFVMFNANAMMLDSTEHIGDSPLTQGISNTETINVGTIYSRAQYDPANIIDKKHMLYNHETALTLTSVFRDFVLKSTEATGEQSKVESIMDLAGTVPIMCATSKDYFNYIINGLNLKATKGEVSGAVFSTISSKIKYLKFMKDTTGQYVPIIFIPSSKGDEIAYKIKSFFHKVKLAIQHITETANDFKGDFQNIQVQVQKMKK